MDWIIPYINNPVVCNFHNKICKLEKGRNYRSWIGLNFQENEIFSIKFYYTFYKILKTDELSSIFIFGDIKDYYKQYEKASINDILRVNDAGSGFTFSVKLNLKTEPVFGYYMKQVFQQNDIFFNIPETEKYFEQGGVVESIDFVKNIAVFYNSTGVKNEKNYYYIKNKTYKRIISELFCEPEFLEAPVIEYAIGYGHRDAGNNRLNDRKAIIFGDFKKYAELYLNKWKLIEKYTKDIQNKGLQVYCPALYGDRKCYSLYVFDFTRQGALIENLYSELHK